MPSANVFTDLIPVLYSAAQEVSAEPTGALQSVNLMFDDKGAAYGETVRVPYAPVATLGDFTPAATSSMGTDKTAASVDVSITFSKNTAWHLTGEQQRSLENSGTNNEWVRQLVAQGMRSLRNYAELQCLNAIKAGASRATGTAGTNAFLTDASALVDARSILIANGTPMSDPQCILSPASYGNLLKTGIINQASMAGSDEERRSGVLGRQYGFTLRESGQIVAHTIGTASGTLLSATEPVGETSLAYDTDTNGPWTAGDVVTLGSGGGSGTADTAKYIVSAANSATPLVINRPGLLLQHVDNDTMTVGAAYTPNFCFERNAVVGILRPPLMPANPTITQQLISDGKGLTYLLCQIAQYGMVTWELHLAGGFKAVQSEHICTILG